MTRQYKSQQKIESCFVGGLIALAALTLGATSARADTIYGIAFNDTAANPVFGSTIGSFAVDGSQKVTGLRVTFTVLRSFTDDHIVFSPGDVLTFDTSAPATSIAGSFPTYDPVRNAFNYPAVGYTFLLEEMPPGNPAKGGILYIAGGSDVRGNTYTIDGLANGEFHSNADPGVWTVSPAAPTITPEPASSTLFLLALPAGGFLFIYDRSRCCSRNIALVRRGS